MSIIKTLFDRMPDERPVYMYTIENANGVKASVLTKGATLQALLCPDLEGKMRDIIVGFDNIGGYLASGTFAGQVIGQYANRISNARFAVDGREYELLANENGETCLHGGAEYSNAVWDAIITDDNALELSYLSADGTNGFPGNVQAKVRYVLTDKNELEIHYSAVSDKRTFINLTNHAYFNLGAADGGSILDTVLTLNAGSFTPTDARSIPTGEIRSVAGTPFDFTSPKPIGRDIDCDDLQLSQADGYDHNFCIDGPAGELRRAATAYAPDSGITLEVYTDLPGVQLYTGNFMNGETGKGGVSLARRTGFCLETQFYPDTPNRPEFPQCLYEPGEEYRSLTVFKLSAKKEETI